MRALAPFARPLSTCALAPLACALALVGCGSSAHKRVSATRPFSTPASTVAEPAPAPPPPPPPHAPFAVGLRTLTFVDDSRQVTFPGQPPQPRTLVTLVRYPALGRPSSGDVPNAPPVGGAGSFPLVIFGHGFTLTPAPYAALLEAWARAGYVVAAPVFPLENENAPGGPDESDLVNQPRDMSFLITQLLSGSAGGSGFLSAMIDPDRVAVSGQSDGGETALAVAYDGQFIDRRVKAAVILSGAKIPGVGGFDFPPPSPPLLATQGTVDTINPPGFTQDFFDGAPPPKYLLTMFGAGHIGPYTDEQPQLGIVERVTIAFLDRYLKGEDGAYGRMLAAGNVGGITALQAGP